MVVIAPLKFRVHGYTAGVHKGFGGFTIQSNRI